tara:strand:- start:77 stop:1054 length:978 start_codon:yes stop_codon:yes gene_type:complete
MNNIELIDKLNSQKDDFYKEIKKVIIGQDDVLEYIFIAMLSKGHIILEGVPGLGKTLIIKMVSDILSLDFNRIQFTPDLMPSDIVGTEILNQSSDTGKRGFEFVKGPIFSNIILADEINRTPPKTQSALLEAMQEYNVTIGGKTYNLDTPFFVMATQNPIEQEGTYPLPEAQLDRFMFNVIIDYPTLEEEVDIVKMSTSINDLDLKKIISKEELLKYQDLVLDVPVAENVIEYATKFVNSTRPINESCPEVTKKYINWGAGPRASMYLILAAKAKAAISGRATPEIDDVISLIKPVLRHRIIPNFNAEAEGIKSDDILEQLIDSM